MVLLSFHEKTHAISTIATFVNQTLKMYLDSIVKNTET